MADQTEQGSTVEDDNKSTKSGPKSQAGSKPASRVGSGQSGKSGKSGGSKKVGDAPVPPSPTASAKDNPAADWRTMRRIIAEDPEYSLATVPRLIEICITHIVSNFESKYTSCMQCVSNCKTIHFLNSNVRHISLVKNLNILISYNFLICILQTIQQF